MPWLKVLFASLAVLANTPGSTGMIVTKNGTPRPTMAAPTVVRRSGSGSASFVSGSGSIESIIEALSASASGSASGMVSFAAIFDAVSTSGSGSAQSSGSSKSLGSTSVASVEDDKVTVTSSTSSNYSALITYGSGNSYELATPLTAKSSVVPTYRNWVGPKVVQSDAACWREAHIMDECPSNYDRHEATNTCWAECPIEFPVRCGVECVRQNDDCGREIFYKVSSIINVGLNGIMDNWFGKFALMAKKVRTAVYCSCMILSLIRAMLRYIRSIKSADPQASQDKILTALYQSNAVVVELPITIKYCMGDKPTKSWWLADRVIASTQFILSQTFGVIINDLITKGKSNNGTSYKANEYTYTALNQGLNFWVVTGFDMTGISSMISDYFMAICGPTQFIGEVDDGSHPDTLGLNIIQKAFQNSTMVWTKKGDGEVIINFTSYDTKNVTVNIMSGGDKVDEVDVASGGKATWKSTVKKLGGKTLYLDRWRPGFLGLPGTGGGSLMLWVPHAAEGGHLDLNVRLNVS
ncbi:hypothetical protein JG688_00018667 [Phytophthora aleatoria]|uniref:Jacalin-type lectin domain-containing protein n=1 Tax=Phytophthora aleatoria TaxID=2496075 RepID=A0A8J5I1W2_9STRA|nr:hypothetical protein JG688_00018667 [Phytophthora aleatoria]